MSIDDIMNEIAEAAGSPVPVSPGKTKWFKEGEHLFQVNKSLRRTSQKGRDCLIVEGEILKSTTHRVGEAVKIMFTLSGIEGWRVKKEKQRCADFVTATTWKMEGITPEDRKGLWGPGSILEGRKVYVEGESPEGKDYVLLSFLPAEKCRLEGGTGTSVGETSGEASGGGETSGGGEEPPPFDI